MKTSSAKSKGRELQKYVVRVINKVFKDKFECGDVVSRPMGSSGVDIMMSPNARKNLPLSIECKNTKSFPSLSALAQSRANSYNKTLAAVVWKPFGKSMDESIIYFNTEDFISWIKELQNAKKV